MSSVGAKIELRSFNLTVTLIIATVLAVIISFASYFLLLGLTWESLNIPETWSTMFDNLFSAESLFFLIFFSVIIGVVVLIISYNAIVTLLMNQHQCSIQKLKWNSKKGSCV